MASAALKIVRFVLAERVEVSSDFELLPSGEVPAVIQLLNPSPGTLGTMLEFAVGVEATGLEPHAPVSAMIELCHAEVGKWLLIWQQDATVGPEGGRWLLITNVHFPPAREGTYKFRLTLTSSGVSQRVVRKVAVRYRTTMVGSA